MKTKIIIVVLLIIVAAAITKCSQDVRIAKKSMEALKTEYKKLDSIKNKQGEVILTQQTTITSNQQALRELTDTIFNLKKSQDKKIKSVIAYYSSVSNTGIKEKKVPYLDTIKMKKFSDSLEAQCQEVIQFMKDSTVLVGKQAKDSTKDFTFKATIGKDTLNINEISFPDSTYLRFVETKGGLFKPNKVEIQIKHTNPYVNVTSAKSVLYKPPKKLGILSKVFILVGGIFLGSKL